VSISTSPDVRCPRCSAHVRAGSDWCTLCYADLRPAAAEPVAPVPTPVPPDPAEAAPEQGGPTEQPPAGRGKHARKGPAYDDGDVTAAAVARANALADQLLAELAATEGKNPLGPLAGFLDSTGKRVALILGATATVICLILLLMAGIGLLL
jgi:hypothetical protein